MITREDFAQAFLKEMGWRATKRNMWALLSWMQAEGQGGKFNPLNTTQKMPGSTDFNDVPVQNYVSFQQGVAATAKTMRQNQRNYDRIRRCFAGNAFAKWTLTAVENSAWGTGGLALECLPFVKRYFPNYASKPIVQ